MWNLRKYSGITIVLKKWMHHKRHILYGSIKCYRMAMLTYTLLEDNVYPQRKLWLDLGIRGGLDSVNVLFLDLSANSVSSICEIYLQNKSVYIVCITLKIKNKFIN